MGLLCDSVDPPVKRVPEYSPRTHPGSPMGQLWDSHQSSLRSLIVTRSSRDHAHVTGRCPRSLYRTRQPPTAANTDVGIPRTHYVRVVYELEYMFS